MSGALGGPLQIVARGKRGGIQILEVSGDLVITSREDLRRAVERSIEGGHASIVVDAARLSYVDTPSLALLAALAARCREEAGVLVVAGLPAEVLPLVEALRLEEAVPLAPDAARALDLLGA